MCARTSYSTGGMVTRRAPWHDMASSLIARRGGNRVAPMYLARVIGTVVATVKYTGLEGTRLLIVEPVDDEGAPCGAPHAAVDVTQAGPGEHVFCVGSREAALACEPTFVPVDAAIVGIVDAVDVPRPGSGA